jgi:hypothetical protein
MLGDDESPWVRFAAAAAGIAYIAYCMYVGRWWPLPVTATGIIVWLLILASILQLGEWIWQRLWRPRPKPK